MAANTIKAPRTLPAPAAPFSSLLSSVLLSVSLLSVLSVLVVVTVTVVALPEAMLNSVKRRCDWSQLVDLEISSNNSILLPLVGPEYSAVSMELSSLASPRSAICEPLGVTHVVLGSSPVVNVKVGISRRSLSQFEMLSPLTSSISTRAKSSSSP